MDVADPEIEPILEALKKQQALVGICYLYCKTLLMLTVFKTVENILIFILCLKLIDIAVN